MWRRLYASPEFLSVRCQAIEEGVEVEIKESALCEFVGWKRNDCQSPKCNNV